MGFSIKPTLSTLVLCYDILNILKCFLCKLSAGCWFGCHFLFSPILGISSSQLTFIFFWLGWPNHRPDLSRWDFPSKPTIGDPINRWYILMVIYNVIYIYLENPTLHNFRHGLKSTQKRSSQRKKGIGNKKRNCWVHTSFLPRSLCSSKS